MSATKWGPLERIPAIKRAAKRDAWNARRMSVARLRRLQAVILYFEAACKRGAQAKAAKELGVHRSTVSRAIAMFQESERIAVEIDILAEDQRTRQRLDRRERRAVFESLH